MSRQIEIEVVEIVSRITKIPADKLGPKVDLRADYNVDSLQGLQIVAAVEKRFGIRVPDEEIDFYTSIGDIVSTVASYQPRQVQSDPVAV